jgi:hypothetical protein
LIEKEQGRGKHILFSAGCKPGTSWASISKQTLCYFIKLKDEATTQESEAEQEG